MTAYYNEIDPYAAQWLRNLIDGGHIARGDVDERSIVDVRADDLKSYTQCHFFAGIGGWSIALRLAGWDDDRPVWTGSCPCQPFSAAGAGKAADDQRHLWPAWFPLIAERRPSIVFGEQVEAAIGWGWLDAVFADLEGEGYACGASVLPACGVGAPHIRNRLWFVADASSTGHQPFSGGMEAQNGCSGYGWKNGGQSERGRQTGRLAYADGGDASTEGLQRGGEHGQRPQDGGAGRLGNAESSERRLSERPQRQSHPESAGAGEASELGNADGAGPQGWRIDRNGADERTAGPASVAGFWSDADWLPCTDGKARPVGPGSFPLGHGIQRRTSKLRAYGNAIVPQVAAQFIGAAMSAAVASHNHRTPTTGD